jgi:hypothetical protein
MSSGEEIDHFYDILFEMSNDIRHNILRLLIENPERMTNILKMGLTPSFSEFTGFMRGTINTSEDKCIYDEH